MEKKINYVPKQHYDQYLSNNDKIKHLARLVYITDDKIINLILANG